MMNIAKPDNIAGTLGGITSPVVSLCGPIVANKAGLPKEVSIPNSVSNPGSCPTFLWKVRGACSLFHAHLSLFASGILKGSSSMGIFISLGGLISESFSPNFRSSSVLSEVFSICRSAYVALALMVHVSTKSVFKCFCHASILASIILMCQVPVYSAFPDTITDPAVRDALDYIDGKVDSVMATVINSSATLGIPSGILPIIGGGTGAGTDAGARANLGVPSVTGDGATGTWNISITGAVAQTTSLAGGGIGYIPYQSAQNTTVFLAPGPVGYVLTSAGAATPTWTNATHLNTPSTIMKRDANGDFAAGTVTATAFVGDGSGLTGLSLVGGAGVLQLDADGNLTPDDLVIQDSYLEVIGNDIQPL